MTPPPGHDVLVAHPKCRCDLRTEQPKYCSDPAICREQADRLTPRVDCNCNEMADLFPNTVLERRSLRRQCRSIGNRDFREDKRRRSDRHPIGTQKSMKMPVLPD